MIADRIGLSAGITEGITGSTTVIIHDSVTGRTGTMIDSEAPGFYDGNGNRICPGQTPWLLKVRWSERFESWVGFRGLKGYHLGYQTEAVYVG